MLGALIIFGLMAVSIWLFGAWLLKRQCPSKPPRIVYKRVPRTFIDEQLHQPSVFKMYSSMFWKQEPWLGFVESQSSNKGIINPMILGGLPTTSTGNVRESNSFIN